MQSMLILDKPVRADEFFDADTLSRSAKSGARIRFKIGVRTHENAECDRTSLVRTVLSNGIIAKQATIDRGSLREVP